MGQALNVSGRNAEAVASIGEEVGNCPHVGGHDGQVVSHGLYKNDPKWFLARGHAKHGGIRVVTAEVGWCHATHDMAARLFDLRGATDDGERGVRNSLTDQPESREQFRSSLPFPIYAYKQDIFLIVLLSRIRLNGDVVSAVDTDDFIPGAPVVLD